MGQEQDIIDQITTVTGKIKSQKLDEATRLQALSAAQVLLETLESPFERIIHDVVMHANIGIYSNGRQARRIHSDQPESTAWNNRGGNLGTVWSESDRRS
ncbi:O-methyltransferase family 2 [Penicillium odoratum]|uniref:O-methyltransferase family 2 n=1 Tax=Penicillium odoratum TaxID=1167516 RepID=UPI0025486440|nr:O-methyltransferase family 2 [Penicillium odoratum]KAJ5753261.1 O-methyltransferase family 2 [Penicillium odoratum]